MVLRVDSVGGISGGGDGGDGGRLHMSILRISMMVPSLTAGILALALALALPPLPLMVSFPTAAAGGEEELQGPRVQHRC